MRASLRAWSSSVHVHHDYGARGMLERGVYLAPSQYEAGFMSLAHTEADVDKTIAAAKEVFATI